MVGYSDVYPNMPLGKFISEPVALSAIGLFALPAGILAAGFAESIQKRRTDNTGQTIVGPQRGTDFDIQAGTSLRDSKKTSENEASEKSYDPEARVK